jgi:hypothetical protein
MKTRKTTNNTKLFFLYLIVVSVILILSGCAEPIHISEHLIQDPHGFLGGLWHGIILPFSFIGSLFSDNIAIYAVNNCGGWYDFGFVLGSGVIITGSSR